MEGRASSLPRDHAARPTRDDAVVWGFARGAAGGAEIHQYTGVTGLERDGDRIAKVHTNRGSISAGVVLNCTAGWRH
ncbi:MAG TPA: FAD-dependent oxidoreductase [Solirubrobacteraceae bacterium]|nr:FAD-dependent oxidoreductase [Solirubrobacteraceae bacterium]